MMEALNRVPSAPRGPQFRLTDLSAPTASFPEAWVPVVHVERFAMERLADRPLAILKVCGEG
jgi:hypothetical protein